MEKIRIVVLDSYALCAGELCFARLEKMGDLRVYERTPQELAVERIGDAQIVLTNKVLITREVMEACKAVSYTHLKRRRRAMRSRPLKSS